MSPVREAFERFNIGFPRVSGDEPITAQLAANGVEFSPRERG